ncbi:hypothetical protein Z043_107174 [Scleropages formosus]|uniref:PAS domain-containing protein n=1 Tax=Scleropages formosus TaxID=113540 RepID=A0A0P7Z0A8_SCLFO|nr:hypothetical protein Z043_107174 [Scleropages formosus]
MIAGTTALGAAPRSLSGPSTGPTCPSAARLTGELRTRPPARVGLPGVAESDSGTSVLPGSVLFLLGYSPQEMTGRSWYSMVHPEDLHHGASRHRSLRECALTFTSYVHHIYTIR